MAINVSFDQHKVTCILHACSFKGKCNNQTETTKKITNRLDSNKITPLTRLALYHIMSQKYRIDDILKRYKKSVISTSDKSPGDLFRLLEEAIITECKIDANCKICPDCESDYRSQHRAFEHVLFVMPNVDKCVEHML